MSPAPNSRAPYTPKHLNLVLGLVGIVAFALGIWQIRNSIRLPFVLEGTNSSESNVNASQVDNSDEALRSRDTDGDGLSDYDEKYIYKTSPYLKDTDSDGYTDGEEVKTGHDPLDHMPKVSQLVTPTATVPESGTGAPALTAAEIRALLKKSGATDDMLAKYDDATLLQFYNQMASEGQTTPNAIAPATGVDNSQPAPTLSELTPQQKESLLKLSAPELRKFLIKGGMDQKVLENIDDSTLQQTFKQLLGI